MALALNLPCSLCSIYHERKKTGKPQEFKQTPESWGFHPFPFMIRSLHNARHKLHENVFHITPSQNAMLACKARWFPTLIILLSTQDSEQDQRSRPARHIGHVERKRMHWFRLRSGTQRGGVHFYLLIVCRDIIFTFTWNNSRIWE